MNQPSRTGKRIVSKGEYVFRKTLAIGLSVSLFVCGISIVLLLLSVQYSSDLDASLFATCLKTEHTKDGVPWCERRHYFDFAMMGFIFLTVLLFVSFLLRWGKRKTWETVRAMQPINSALTADLPASDNLVRASKEPKQEQQAVLLRAATEGLETSSEQLVRAAVGKEQA
jgi:hypothetical protein